MEERQEIQVKTLPWMSEDDTKHTSKARKNPILVGDDFHRMRAKGTCLYPDVSYLAVFELSICVNSKSPVSILSFWYGAVFYKSLRKEFRKLKWLWQNWVEKWNVYISSWNTWRFAFWLKCSCLYNLKVSLPSQNYFLYVICLSNGLKNNFT